MDCPKCGHKQRDEVRCESCGIYFEKYHRRQTKRPSADSGLKSSRRPLESGFGNTIKIAFIASAVIGLGLSVAATSARLLTRIVVCSFVQAPGRILGFCILIPLCRALT